MAGRYHANEAYDSSVREEVVSSLRSMSSPKTKVFILVLCGREEPLKTFAAKALSEHHPVSNMSEKVSVVQLPGLFGKSQEEVKRETSKCFSQCEPDGAYAFVHVLPLSPPSSEDKEEFKAIQRTFRSQLKFLNMILFIVEVNQTDADVDKLLKENKDIQDLIQSCDGRRFFLNTKEKQQFPELGEDLRMVLIGKTGSGKGSTANMILGTKAFIPKALPKPPNTTCEKKTGEFDGRTVSLVNTPDLCNPTLSDEEIQDELSKCSTMLAPGPHVFLLVLPIGSISSEDRDSVEMIKRVFGERSKDYIIIIFTRGDDLDGDSIESYIQGCDDSVKKLVNDCGKRYQVFKRRDENRQQARELLTKIENMVKKNGGGCYSAEMFLFTREAIHREVQQIMQKEREARRRQQEEIEEIKKRLEALERDKQQRVEKQDEEMEDMNERPEAPVREKQQSWGVEKKLNKMEEFRKKLEALEREKQENERTKKHQEEMEEMKKKLEALERDKEQNERAKKEKDEIERIKIIVQALQREKTQDDETDEKEFQGGQKRRRGTKQN